MTETYLTQVGVIIRLGNDRRMTLMEPDGPRTHMVSQPWGVSLRLNKIAAIVRFRIVLQSWWSRMLTCTRSGAQSGMRTISSNITIKDPITTKNHIADYFEDLYQAREAESTHETWTKAINEKIKQITKTNTNETPNEITLEELNKNIKTLKRGKSTGPDDIPNEAIIEANKTNRTTINNILNNIYNTEKIPDQWQKGEIIRFYKGKGNKGKCSNERGITLGSNMGKLFERIINNRISKVVNISDAQAGGKKEKQQQTTS